MSFFGGIKRTTADALFSDYVREKAGWRCSRCGKDCNNNHAGLHNSHFKSRANTRVRFDEDNAFAMCVGCHDFLGKNPDEHSEWVRRRLGEDRYQALIVRANTRRSVRVDHKLETIRWRAALRELRKKTQVVGAKA